MAEEEKEKRTEEGKTEENVADIEEVLNAQEEQEEEGKYEEDYQETDIDELLMEDEETPRAEEKKEGFVQRALFHIRENKALVIGAGAGLFMLLSVVLFFSGTEGEQSADTPQKEATQQALHPPQAPSPQVVTEPPPPQTTTPPQDIPQGQLPPAPPPQPPPPPQQDTLSYIPDEGDGGEVGVPIPTAPPVQMDSTTETEKAEGKTDREVPPPEPKETEITLQIPAKIPRPEAKIELKLSEATVPQDGNNGSKAEKVQEEKAKKETKETNDQNRKIKTEKKAPPPETAKRDKTTTKVAEKDRKRALKRVKISKKTLKKPSRKKRVATLSVLEIYEGMFFKALDGNNYWEGDTYKGMKVLKVRRGYVILKNGDKKLKLIVKRGSDE